MASATHVVTRQEADAHPPLESMVVRFAGDSGDGMQLTGGQFTLSTALAGNDLATFPDFPAEIRAPQGTTFGVSAFQINFGSTAIETAGDQPDVLVAMNPAALRTNVKALRDGGLIIADEGRVHRPQPRQGRLRRQSARRRQPGALAADQVQYLATDDGRGQAVRPRQQGSAALQEHVDARPRLVDVRPRPRADHRLAQDQIRQGAAFGRSQYRRAQRRPCLWRDDRDRQFGHRRRAPASHCRRAGRTRPLPHRDRRRIARDRPRRGSTARRPQNVFRVLPDHAGQPAAPSPQPAEGISASPLSRPRTRLRRSARRSAPVMPASSASPRLPVPASR